MPMLRQKHAFTVCALGLFACGEEPHLSFGERDVAGSTATLTAALVVATTSGLPSCSTSLAGTTAYVQQGSAIYTCARGSWSREYCTVDRAGEVAFVTGETFLLACSAKAWSQVALPTGGAGPAGDAGPAGRSSLVRTFSEPVGSNCSAGGLRVTAGVDTNGSGVLDSGEVTSTSYVCNGSSGSSGTAAAPVRTSVRAASTTECRAGGQLISVYQDANGNAAEDPGEAAGAPILVCNGDPVAANGATPVVKAYRSVNDLGVTAGEGSAGTQVVLSATLDAPRPGTVVAFASAVAFCSSPSVPADQAFGRCASPVGSTTAFLTVVDAGSSSQGGNSGESIAVTALREDADEQITASAAFNVNAGPVTLNVLGMAADNTPDAAGTSVYYGASQLTLFFIPND